MLYHDALYRRRYGITVSMRATVQLGELGNHPVLLRIGWNPDACVPDTWHGYPLVQQGNQVPCEYTCSIPRRWTLMTITGCHARGHR